MPKAVRDTATFDMSDFTLTAEDRKRIERSVLGIKQVTIAQVNRNTLVMTLDLSNLSEGKRKSVTDKVLEQVRGIVQHRADSLDDIAPVSKEEINAAMAVHGLSTGTKE